MEKKYTPVLPFDATINDSFIVYDNETYKCRIDQYQSENPIALHQKTMVKYYNCDYKEKPVRLGGD